MHDILDFRKVSARWVPKHVIEDHKRKSQHICPRLLERYSRECERFLNCIITGNEAWTQHYESETKRQNMQRKYTSSPFCKKFRSQPPAGKHLLTVFLDSQGHILQHCVETGTTVTSVNYCDVLRKELRPAIHTKRRGRLSQGVVCYTTMHAFVRHTSPSTPFKK